MRFLMAGRMNLGAFGRISRACGRFVCGFLFIAMAVPFGGCLSPAALDHVAIAYNEAVANVMSEQLLLNIARARYNQPIQFAGISNIAATMNFQANAGMTPALAGTNGAMLLPSLGGSVSENPTISIVPIEGEEFTQRMLTPLADDKLTLLLRQNLDVDLLLRLVALEFRTNDGNVFHNRPRNVEDYSEFRRIGLHLASIQHSDQLYAEPLIFEKQWTLPLEKISAKAFQSLQKEFSIHLNAKDNACVLTKQVTGRMLLTNYDPSVLSNQERMNLNEEAEKNSQNDLLVDIRADYPGGKYPIHGKFRLRSFSNIMYFIGRGISTEPEFMVSPDPRTPTVKRNPVSVLAVRETDLKPTGAEVSAYYRDKYYSLDAGDDTAWNQTAFRVLSQIYQMTVTELPRTGVPSITIAK